MSQKELPEIPWNEGWPGFHIVAETDVPGPVLNVLGAGHCYRPGSFMGCSCGFLYYHDRGKKSFPDDWQERERDVADLRTYLLQHIEGNTIRLFGTYWNNFPEIYPEGSLDVSGPQPEEFDIEEDVIYQVTNGRPSL